MKRGVKQAIIDAVKHNVLEQICYNCQHRYGAHRGEKCPTDDDRRLILREDLN